VWTRGSPLAPAKDPLCSVIYSFAIVFPTATLMYQSHTTPASSFNFQLLFNNALKAYEKHTKKDLLAHPLAAQLQSCDSPTAILAVLQQQVQELNQSRNSNEGLTNWLDPTINILFVLSGSLGEGIGLVSSGYQLD
jgi:hypothetical protein